MADEIKKVDSTAQVEITERTGNSRRVFVTKAAQVAITAPAAAMILGAAVKPATAQVSVYQATQQHILDDFTFGNNEEDIDASAFGNFNPINGVANQDDHIPT